MLTFNYISVLLISKWTTVTSSSVFVNTMQTNVCSQTLLNSVRLENKCKCHWLKNARGSLSWENLHTHLLHMIRHTNIYLTIRIQSKDSSKHDHMSKLMSSFSHSVNNHKNKRTWRARLQTRQLNNRPHQRECVKDHL